MASGRLWEFLERLNAFRREGKDRRDAGTLAVKICLQAFE